MSGGMTFSSPKSASVQRVPKRVEIDAMRQLIQFDGEAPPPVGMLICRAGNVRLLLQPDQIVERD